MSDNISIRMPVLLRFIAFIKENPGTYAIKVAKRTGLTYSHIVKIKKICIEKSIIRQKNEGKVNSLFLTEAGEELATIYIALEQKIKEFSLDELPEIKEVKDTIAVGGDNVDTFSN